ncbi:hypothetical protein AB0M92_37075 [Streptomyces sp. NPDC051582]|uniref:hypothetical protein n=1 Tax=Streptomyces sp. NPDC051582 TaxID=3155167 RepID=UPI003438A644
MLFTHERARASGLPATEGKRDDPRWPAVARRFTASTSSTREVEALEPDELQRLVLAAVDPYIDRDVLDRDVAREQEQHRALAGFLGGRDTAADGPF